MNDQILCPIYIEGFKKLSVKLFLHILKKSQHISLCITPSRHLINRDSKKERINVCILFLKASLDGSNSGSLA